MNKALSEEAYEAIDNENTGFFESEFPRMSDHERSLAFSTSARRNSIELCKLFISKGLSFGEEDFIGFSPASSSVKAEGVELLKFFLENGMDPNSTGSGDTLLGWACRLENADAVDLLLRYGADQNFKYHKDALSPLQRAVHIYKKDYKNSERITKALLENGPDFKWKKNKLAVTRACNLGNFKLAKLIIESANLKLSSDKQYTTSYSPCGTPLSYAIKANDIEFTRFLIARKAKPSVFDGFRSYFSLILETGSVDMVDLLLEYDSVPDEEDKLYTTQRIHLRTAISKIEKGSLSKEHCEAITKIENAFRINEEA